MQATDQTLEERMSHLITRHLSLMQKKLLFPSKNEYLISNRWFLNPFPGNGTDYTDALLELRTDYSQKQSFETFDHTMDFWVALLDIPEYEKLAKQAT